MMVSFRSQCLEKVNNRKVEFGPVQLRKGYYPGLVLIVASLEANAIMLYPLLFLCAQN